MMGSAALYEAADDLGLGFSDDAIAQSILADPSFAGVNGQFDEPTFRACCRKTVEREIIC